MFSFLLSRLWRHRTTALHAFHAHVNFRHDICGIFKQRTAVCQTGWKDTEVRPKALELRLASQHLNVCGVSAIYKWRSLRCFNASNLETMAGARPVWERATHDCSNVDDICQYWQRTVRVWQSANGAHCFDHIKGCLFKKSIKRQNLSVVSRSVCCFGIDTEYSFLDCTSQDKKLPIEQQCKTNVACVAKRSGADDLHQSRHSVA